MLYRAYSNPFEIMNIYINQGRFGEFVSGFIDAEHKRKKAEAEKDEENKLWLMYLSIKPQKSFAQWKNDLVASSDSRNQNQGGGDESLDDEKIESIFNELFPDDENDSPKRGENS